jgi:hypothetical protein
MGLLDSSCSNARLEGVLMVLLIKSKSIARTFKICPFCWSRFNCIHFKSEDSNAWTYELNREMKRKKRKRNRIYIYRDATSLSSKII